MGIDAGFDMVPRLSKGLLDRQNWDSFLNVIKERYKDDDLVEVKPNYIVFKAGEYPMLPFEGHKLLRFSSKISGSHANGVGNYIHTVSLVAEMHFGSRVRSWDEGRDEWGFYNWTEVHESVRSYEQPDELEISTSIAQLVLGTDPFSELDIPLFEVRSIPNKGNGLVARFKIAKGKRILSEKPLFTTRNLSPISLMESDIATKLKAPSKDEQRQFLSLHNNFPGKQPFSGIIKTNALPCGSGSPIGGIYPTICLINHSCLPNAHNNWNSETEHETIHATRFIEAGEEITIPYDRGEPSEQRRTHLKDNFGFVCTCALCSSAPDALQASDNRRVLIQRLDAAIGDPARVLLKPDACLADCRALLQTLEEEYSGAAASLNARLYYDAFQICITHGDQARASVFAERAFKARVVCEGEDSPATKKVKKLMDQPAGHASFGTSRRWASKKGMVPKGVDTEEFERWLWREGR